MVQGFDFTALIFPGILIGALCLKYAMKRLYQLYFAKQEAQRVANLSRLLRGNPLLQPSNEDSTLTQSRSRDALPPPPYELAIEHYSAFKPVFCIQVDDETPPPTYADWLKMSDEPSLPSTHLKCSDTCTNR